MSRKKRRSKARREAKRGERNQERADRLIRMKLKELNEKPPVPMAQGKRLSLYDQSVADMADIQEPDDHTS